jgi:lipopolysaccharide/colanic/teichoic acid biosynthesis glycosyltransferase
MQSILLIGPVCCNLLNWYADDNKGIYFSDLPSLKRNFKGIAEFTRGFDAVLIDLDQDENSIIDLTTFLTNNFLNKTTFIGITKRQVKPIAQHAFQLGLHDVYSIEGSPEHLMNRLKIIKQIRNHPSRKTNELLTITPKISRRKRLFDFTLSALALFALSPLMLFIAIGIKLESKGPIFFISPRAGTGFKVFDFYKFRSMSLGAEEQLYGLLGVNQYKSQSGTSFIKINQDPRVTRVGWFLRKTSLDELPQLINVLKGDMSIVGNRPLPLYEAQSLTRDQISKRFLAPAGLTGLWQVTKRGKSDMSVEDRILLDIAYMEQRNGWFDLKIIWRTIPAMIQRESV